MDDLQAVFNCKTTHLPMTYLGAPLGGNMKRLKLWEPIVDKVCSRLSSWKAKALSRAGRLTLIRSVLNSIPVYYLGVFRAPKLVVEKIEKLQRAFLWSGSETGRFLATAQWRQLQLSKAKGGLGVGGLAAKNLALLTKWVWRFNHEVAPLWKRVVVSIHGASRDNLLGTNGWVHKGSVWNELVSHIQADNTATTILSEGLKWSVGDGGVLRFWEDRWCGEGCLRDRFPRLYSISTQKGFLLSQVGCIVGSHWVWHLLWRRHFLAWEEEVLVSLNHNLSGVSGNVFSRDVCRWALSSDGLFSTFSFRKRYEDLTCTTIQDLHGVWRGLAIPKAELTTWFALQGKLNVRHRLVRVGMITIDKDKCPFCGICEEMVDHVLLHCSFVWKIWCAVLDWWGSTWCVSRGLMDWYITWMGVRSFGFRKKLWQSLFYVVVWSVWLERNGVVFEQKEVDWVELVYLIKLRAGFWVKVWCKEFPYSPTDVVRNIDGVRTWGSVGV